MPQQGWAISGHMLLATTFSVARGSNQEICSNLKFPPTYHSNVSAEANLNRDLLLFSLEGMALC